MTMDLRKKALSKRLPEHMFNKVHEAIGEASMCWSETPKGVFDSTKAGEVALNLCQLVADELEKRRK